MFDEWYAGGGGTAAWDRHFGEVLGLPPGFATNGFVPWEGVEEIAAALQSSGLDIHLLVDVGCGRGDYARALASLIGTKVTGVDQSQVAIKLAREASWTQQRPGDTWVIGDLVATGLFDGCADAVVCLDALHFAEDQAAASRELRRLLRPGGRLAVATWQAADPVEEWLPERLRRVDPQRDLPAAGFTDVVCDDKPQWLELQRDLYTGAAQTTSDDLAVLREEASDVLPTLDHVRRLLVTATAA